MAVKKKTIDTTAKLKAEMKKNGVRLPHGYTVVKRKPTAKKEALKPRIVKQSAGDYFVFFGATKYIVFKWTNKWFFENQKVKGSYGYLTKKLAIEAAQRHFKKSK